MSTPPVSRRTSNSDPLVSSSDSRVESRDDEQSKVKEKSKSTSPPVMKTHTKKHDQREAYKAIANESSTSMATYAEKNHDIRKNFKTEIDAAQKLNAKKQQWDKFSKKIDLDGVLSLRGLIKEEIQDFVDWLKTNPKDKIIKLDLNYISIGAEGVKALADMLKTNKTITRLNLTDCNIDAEDAKALAQALKSNTTITTLHLNNNKFGPNGAKAIAEAIKDNPDSKISTLSLHSNAIGAEGAKDIVAAIVGNPNSKITALFLANNRIGPVGVNALIEPLKANVTITTLDLGANYIGDDGIKSIAKILKVDKTINTINLRENRITGEGFKDLAAMLKTNTSITTINISLNKIDDQSAEAIAEALIANPNSKITTIKLRSYSTYSEGLKFSKIIEQQCALNAQRAQIENNIAGALDLLTAHPNPNDGNVTSVREVNDLIAEKLFALDKADKLNTDEVKKDPSSVFNKYT